MSLVLGQRVGPFPGRLDADLVARYAAATGDPTATVPAGSAIPITAIVTQIWEPQNAAREALVDPDLAAGATGGVHGSHDILLHRPLVVGEPLQIWVDGHGARPAGRNYAVTLRYSAHDSVGNLVAEQWWTTVLFGVTGPTVGERAPDHTLASEDRERTVGTTSFTVDEGMARRYAEVSGDWSVHHFELEAARRSGFDRLFLHGLCTMGLCARSVVDMVGGGDPAALSRLAVRFASPTFLGDTVKVTVYDSGGGRFGFEARADDRTVISHGCAEVR